MIDQFTLSEQLILSLCSLVMVYKYISANRRMNQIRTFTLDSIDQYLFNNALIMSILTLIYILILPIHHLQIIIRTQRMIQSLLILIIMIKMAHRSTIESIYQVHSILYLQILVICMMGISVLLFIGIVIDKNTSDYHCQSHIYLLFSGVHLILCSIIIYFGVQVVE